MPMSECTNSEVRDLLPLLASGAHAPSSADVEAHVAACGSCRRELELLRSARRALLRAPTMDSARIARALPAYQGSPRAESDVVAIDSRRRKAPVWRIAAAALVVIASGTALAVRQASDGGETTPVVASGESEAPVIGGATGPFAASNTVGPSPADSQSGMFTSVLRDDAGTQMTFGGGLADLSEEELVALLAALDDEDALTPVEPDEAFPAMSVDGEEES